MKLIDFVNVGIVSGLIVGFFAGIGLAFYQQNEAWLILAAVSFIVLYAG
jgi:hypothetical protein